MFKSRSTVSALGASVALLAFSGQAMAEEFSWSVNIGGTTDYIFRGISQSGEDPTVQGGLDVGYGIFYAGIWGSGVDEAFTASEFEFDIYAGIKPVWGPATFDFGVIYYGYGNQNAPVDVDYWEFKAGVSGEILPKLTAGFTTYYSPDGTFETGEYWVFEGGLAYALPKVWIFDPSISGVLGTVAGVDDAIDSYTYWNAGLALTVDKLTLDFRYWGTDGTDGVAIGDLGDDRFVFSAKVTLP